MSLYPYGFPNTVIGQTDDRPYLQGSVSNNGRAVVGRTLPDDRRSDTQGIIQLRRGVWAVDPVRGAEQVADEGPLGGTDSNLPVSVTSLANNRWNTFYENRSYNPVRLYYVDWSGIGNAPIPSSSNRDFVGYYPNSSDPGFRLLDMTYSPNGENSAFMGTVQNQGFASNIDQVWIWLKRGPLLIHRFIISIPGSSTTRARYGSLCISNMGRISAIFADEHNSRWFVLQRWNSANFSEVLTGTYLGEDATTRRWHAVCGETFYGGVRLVQLRTSGNPVNRIPDNSRTAQVVSEIPARRYTWGSGAMVNDVSYLCLSWIDPAVFGGVASSLFKREGDRVFVSLYVVPGFSMFTISSNGRALAARMNTQGLIVSNMGVGVE